MNVPTSRYILLVDDNIDDIELTKRAFKKNNILNEVLVANDGEECLEILHNNQEVQNLPSVVLMDINMPRLNGLETLKILRQHPKTVSLPVVILTSSKEDQDLIEGYKNGANSYIRKPVDFTNFTEAIKQLGLYWLVLNEQPPTT